MITPSLPGTPYSLVLAEVFVFLFVTLGPPLKVPAMFLQATATMPEGDARSLALRAFLFAVVTGLVGGFLGRYLMHSWHVSGPAMMLAAGLVFLLVSLRGLLGQYAEATPVVRQAGSPSHTAYEIAVPMLVPAYGMAAIIVLLSHSVDAQRTIWVCALVVLVMVLNLLDRPVSRKCSNQSAIEPAISARAISGIVTSTCRPIMDSMSSLEISTT